MNEPSAEFQLEFLAKVERLLATGGFTATYKFALLIALANVAVERGDDSGREMRVDLGELSREFTRLYWNSARPYPGTGRVLTHSRTKGNAAILGLLAPHVEAYGRPEEAMRRSPNSAQRLVESVRKRVLCRYPLYHLQLFEGAKARQKLFDDFLYELPIKDEAERAKLRFIILKPGVAACFRSLHGVIVSMCEAAWARWIRERNESLGADRQLEAFLFGQDREALSRLAKPLHEMQEGRCFYSGDRLATPASGEVDHFIPWSLYPCNSPFNLVLAKTSVNRAKSNLLPSARHLEQFVRRNREQAGRLVEPLPTGCGATPGDAEAVHAIVRWAYSGGRRVRHYWWDLSNGGRLIPSNEEWEALIEY